MTTAHTIGNSFLTVRTRPRGAELSGLKTADGVEHLWQAAPAIWARHAPILFPIVGRLAQDRFGHDGRTYSMPQHGFARDLDFDLVGHTPHSLSFRLQPSSETRAMYPFEFELDVGYRLDGPTLKIRYEVLNQGPSPMPFSIGAHPGFSLNMKPGDRIEDHYLEFEHDEALETHWLGPDHLLSGETGILPHRGRALDLTPALFDRDALIFFGLRSKRVALCSRRTPRRITVDFPEFPCLGIWAKPGAPFVCIEPWFGYADPHDSTGQLLAKPGICILRPGGSFACEHRITIE